MTDGRHLSGLRSLRNRVQHLSVDEEATQVKSVLAKGTSFFLNFFRANLGEELSENEEAIDEIHGHLREFEEFVEAHMNAIADELTEARALFDCPRCFQQTLVVGTGETHCPFCAYRCSPDELARRLGEGPIDDSCLNCGANTLAFVLYHNEFGADYCTTCGTKQAMCMRCRRRYLGDEYLCPHCGYDP